MLSKQIGFKKKLTESVSYSQRLEMIDADYALSQNRQTSLLDVSNSSLYYERKLSERDLHIMSIIDEIYTVHPYYWNRRISAELKIRGYDIGRKKARTYMGIMRIVAIYPKKKTSIADKSHKKYPYLLKWVPIIRPNQVRSTDITYIKLPWWFVYLLAIIDRYSGKVIAWDVSPSMDWEFCNSVLKKALIANKPEIFNSDQWSQFTSSEFTQILEKAEVKISMDGAGRYSDNIRIERLRRTVKYEDIHINEYRTPMDVYHWLSLYFNKYNNSRLHSSIWYRTPEMAYNDQH